MMRLLTLILSFIVGNCFGFSIKFEHFSVQDGLSQVSVNEIYQDKRGYIWIGTTDGLNKFDGYSFIEFRNDSTAVNTLSNDHINAITEDQLGRLWVGTNNGINIYQPRSNTFRRVNLPDVIDKNLKINEITCFGDKYILISTAKGVYFYNIQQSLFEFPSHVADFISATQNQNIVSIESTLDKKTLIAIAKKGTVFIFDTQQNTKTIAFNLYINQQFKISELLSSLILDDDHILIGTDVGLFALNIQFGHIESVDIGREFSHAKIKKLLRNKENDLWIGTNKGLVVKDADGEIESFVSKTGAEGVLSNDDILSLHQDASGILWIGTWSGGLNKSDLKNRQFNHIFADEKQQNRLSHNVVSSFAENEKFIWVTTVGGGLNRIDKLNGKVVVYRGDGQGGSISHDSLLSSYVDSKNRLWIGSYGSGLNLLEHDKDRFQVYKQGDESSGSISHNSILSIFEDSKGNVWFGTWGGGLNLYQESTDSFIHYKHEANNDRSLSNDVVWSIVEDQYGNLWVGTFGGGLNRFNYKTKDFDVYKHDVNDNSSLSNDSIMAIHDDKEGALWIATYGGGLNKFDLENRRFSHYKESDGLPNNGLYGILEDENGSLWISSNRGITKFDPNNLTFKNFDVNDGLQSNEFNASAFFKAKNGEMFFGGINGFNRFFPQNIQNDQHLPIVVLTDFLLDNKSVKIANNAVKQSTTKQEFRLPAIIDALESITLTHLEKLITFEFAALHYSEPLNNQYAYKLEGWNEDWIYTDAKNRRATYTNLPAGEYTLRIKASNGDGYWNEQGKSLKITVLPAPWLTWWAFTFYAFVIFALAYAFVANEKRKRDVEHAINLRLKQVDKLKDEFLANTSHELRTPLNGIIGLAESLIDGIAGALPDKATKDLSMVVTSGKRLSNLVNDILDFSKLKNSSIALQLKPVDVSSMVDVVLALSRPLKGCKVIKLTNNIDKQLSPVSADEDRLQQILLNLVGNAIKFTDDGCISVTAFTKGNFITIEVKDTGIGIAPEKIESIFESFEQLEGEVTRTSSGTGLGLSITKKLIELHHGKIEVTSEIGVGSTFSVTLPMSHALIADYNSAEQDNIAKLTQSENIIFSPELLLPEDGIDENPGVDIVDQKTIAEKLSKFDEHDYRILVVDDDPINRQVLVNHLSLKNYQVVEASSGEIALEIIKNTQAVIENTQREHSFSHRLSRPFDLILLDVMMPKISGYEVCQRLREHYSVNELPVIFLTAKEQVVDLVQSFSVGGNDYLNKPISKHELLTRVETHLKLLDINRNLEIEVQQRTAELEKAMEAKSEFLAKMSHEIRTPMNAIIGLNHLTLKTALNKNQRDLLSKNQEASQSLLGLINDLLDYSKIEAGKMSIENIAMNVQSLIRKTANICSLKAHSKGIELIVDIHPDVPKTIQSDPVRLQQILVNLVGNAVKFTESGYVLLEVLPVHSKVNQLQFNVIDTGIGLDNSSLSNLFESFTQADSSITRKFGGTGLGLSICKQLTELMDGKIWVESELGKGSKFSFTISFKPSAAEKSANTVPVNVSGLSVLVVDDNHICVNILSEILSSFGCRVTTASSGKEALAQLSAAKLANRLFDVMLTDWHMPDMDGIELAKEVYNNRKHYPVRSALMVTAYDRDDAESLAKNIGINSFIEKPVDASVLLTAMVETLELDKFETQITTTGVIDLSSSNILLVEDNELNQQVVLGFLEETSANVTVAENGLLALEYVKNNAYDVVLMDIQMPEMDGITATTHLRKDYNFDELPIIAMTAHAMEEELNRCIQVGMNEYFTKPIDPNVLYTLLSKWVSRKREITKNFPIKAIDTQKIDSNLGAAVVQTSQTYEELKESIKPETRFTICEQLKALNVIEVDQALEFMGHRVAIYEKLVVDFIRSYMSFDEEIKQLHTNGEFKELYRRVHSFKSNTASIGAKSIADQARICETLIEKDAKSAKSAINQLALLTKDLMRQLSLIQTPEGEEKMIVLDKPKLNHLLTKVQIMLRSEDAEVEDLLPDISRLVQGSVLEKNVSEMIEFIEDIEYPSAISKLEVLLEHTMET